MSEDLCLFFITVMYLLENQNGFIYMYEFPVMRREKSRILYERKKEVFDRKDRKL